MYISRQKKSGFTLVETLIAISILLIAIVGPMTIAARGIQSSLFSREQVTAFQLGQEAMEIVRLMRDANELAGSGWLTNLQTGTGGVCDPGNAAGCGIDVRTFTIRDCTGVDTCRLRLDGNNLGSSRGMYQYEIGALSQFTRRMWIDETAVNEEVEVTVEVSWQAGLFDDTRTITLQSRLFNQD